MTALFATVFATSLVGSLHCLAMCGPIAGMHGRPLAHALGRLATYVVLGALAGGLGRALDLAGDLVAVQRVALVASAVAIVVWGIVQLRWSRGGEGRAFRAGLVRIRARKPATRAWLAGTLTGLLPCGWLWSFVVAAGGTASPALGAATMLVFWLGTVPAMVGALALVTPLVGWMRARMPVITAVALMALGLGTLAMRWTDAGTAQIEHPRCH